MSNTLENLNLENFNLKDLSLLLKLLIELDITQEEIEVL